MYPFVIVKLETQSQESFARISVLARRNTTCTFARTPVTTLYTTDTRWCRLTASNCRMVLQSGCACVLSTMVKLPTIVCYYNNLFVNYCGL